MADRLQSSNPRCSSSWISNIFHIIIKYRVKYFFFEIYSGVYFICILLTVSCQICFQNEIKSDLPAGWTIAISQPKSCIAGQNVSLSYLSCRYSSSDHFQIDIWFQMSSDIEGQELFVLEVWKWSALPDLLRLRIDRPKDLYT